MPSSASDHRRAHLPSPGRRFLAPSDITAHHLTSLQMSHRCANRRADVPNLGGGGVRTPVRVSPNTHEDFGKSGLNRPRRRRKALLVSMSPTGVLFTNTQLSLKTREASKGRTSAHTQQKISIDLDCTSNRGRRESSLDTMSPMGVAQPQAKCTPMPPDSPLSRPKQRAPSPGSVMEDAWR